MLNERFLQYTILDKKLCIDKSMTPHFGRHGTKQFLRGKPIRFGHKVWCLCDRFEYLIQCEPYQGAFGAYVKELGVGALVVLNLLSKFLDGVPFKIYNDRFFSSVKLAEILKFKRIGYTGTIKSNKTKKTPLTNQKEMARLPRGSFDFCLEQRK